MWNIGDIVKIISKTELNGESKELLPIGTICRIEEVCQENDGTPSYGITPINQEDVLFYYLEKELERGQIVWVPEHCKEKCYQIGHEYTDEFGFNEKELLDVYKTEEVAMEACKQLNDDLPDEEDEDYDQYENYWIEEQVIRTTAEE